LAYKIHSAVGNKCVGAKVNKKIVPLNTKLMTGDIVEILTSNSAKGPSFDWLKFVRTASARSKIRAYFKKENKEENILRGKEMLEREARRRGYELTEVFTPEVVDKVLRRHAMSSVDDVYAAVGFGGLTTSQVLTKLLEGFKKEVPPEPSQIPTAERKRSKSGVLVNGNANFTVHFSQCCSPVPGDQIIGYISRGRGVSIHRIDCPNVKGMEDERLIPASWDTDGDESYNATIVLETENKGGLLATITTVISNSKLQIVGVNARLDDKTHTAEMTIVVEIKRASDLEELTNKLRNIDGVISVRRQ
jgi:GTP pyrophosphokinase